MTNGLFWWFVQITINFLSFVIMYIITHALLKRKVTFNWQHVGLAVLYTAVVAPIDYFFGTYVLQIISNLVILLMIKVISQRKIEDTALIFGFYITITGVIQASVLSLNWTLYSLIDDIDQSLVFLIGQLVTTVLIVLVCKKFKLHQWFHALRANIVLKLILLTISLIILIIAFILNFQQEVTYTLFFILALAFVGLILYLIIIRLYHNLLRLISVHDLENSVLSNVIVMMDMDDLIEVKNIFKAHAKELGIDANQLDKEKIQNDIDQSAVNNEKVKVFIDAKAKKYKKDIELITNLTYYKAHEDVDFQLALKWLGTLLDNALEASVKNPIYIDLFSLRDDFSLKVANEYTGEKGQDIEVIFERGYSKKPAGLGIGLHNLHTQVTELDGIIDVDEYYSEAHHCHYLQINIKFKYNLTKSLEKLKDD